MGLSLQGITLRFVDIQVMTLRNLMLLFITKRFFWPMHPQGRTT